MKVYEDEKYHSQRVDLIYAPKYGIYIISFFCALAFAYSYFDLNQKFKYLSWLSVFVVYIASRFFITLYYWDSRKTKILNTKFYDNLNFGISCIGGFIWGVSSYLFLQNTPPERMLIAMTIYAGVCAGGLISNSASLKANLGFTLSLLGVSMTSFLFFSNSEKYTLILVMSLFVLGMVYCGFIINSLVLNNLKLSCEKELLLAEVSDANAKQIIIERQALQTSKMATIGEMASGMAHEINNPLTIIKGNLALLKRHYSTNPIEAKNEFADKSLNKCLENIERIVRVIGSLKRMSQTNFDNPIVSIKTSDLIADSLGFIQEKLKCSNIRLIIESEDEKLRIDCDSITTSQILLTLISHAFHICNYKSESWIKIKSRKIGNSIHFEVSFSEEDHESVHIKNALKNFASPTSTNPGNHSRIYNLSLAQSLANKIGGDIFISEQNLQMIVFKLPLNSKLAKAS